MTSITPHTVIHQKAKLIYSAIIKPDNRCFHVLKCKYVKLRFDGKRVIPIYGCSEANQNGGEKRERKLHKNDPKNNSWCWRQLSCWLHTTVSDLRCRASSWLTTSLCCEMYDEIIRASFTRSHVWVCIFRVLYKLRCREICHLKVYILLQLDLI